MRTIDTDAVLLLSASAFPLIEPCERAAARLLDDVGWVTGATAVFNDDSYAPGERELMSVRPYARPPGTSGWSPGSPTRRWCAPACCASIEWSPDGRTEAGSEPSPWPAGAVSRSRRSSRCGRHRPTLPVFWPMETQREHGAVADLADATTAGPLRARLVAAGALLRELYAYPMAMWLVVFVLIGRSGTFPLSVAPAPFFVMCGALAATRWISSRLGHGIGLHPVDEAREAAYDLPGSFLAVPSALTRRVRRIGFRLPDQPLLWVALVLTLLTTLPLLDRRSTDGSAVGIAVGLVLAALAATWVFALRAFGTRGLGPGELSLRGCGPGHDQWTVGPHRRRFAVRARGHRRGTLPGSR